MTFLKPYDIQFYALPTNNSAQLDEILSQPDPPLNLYVALSLLSMMYSEPQLHDF